MKYLITGAKGQLAKEFIKTFSQKGIDFVALSRDELDIGNFNQVLKTIEELKPNVVINCAAYNYVDLAEKEYALAYKVNAIGPRNLAIACRRCGAFLVHYSTDYVFDGTKEGLYTEEDEPNPLSQYAKSKLLGEIYLKEEIENFLIFRVSWVYGEGKQNFIYKLIKWCEEQDHLRIACDEFSVPTSTRTIVEVTLKALNIRLTGLYHLVNKGYASRYEWAKEVLRIKGIEKFIYPAYQADFCLPAKRPRFSPMSSEKICKELGIQIKDWKEEMKKVLK